MENRYRAEELFGFCEDVFLALGFATADAHAAAEVLNQADRRGIDSHGIARLEGYARLVEAGRIRPSANPRTIHQTPSTANLDGDGGLGLVVARRAMEQAIDKAHTAGSGWTAVHNSSHFGIAYAHAALALEHDMIGMAFTNASPLVEPAGAVEPALGTNPICVVYPAGRYPPVAIDMATTTVANGKLEIAARWGRQLPEGWAIDAEGAPSHDPAVLSQQGSLLPLGSDPEHSFHKGYALGGMVDLFSGVLSGANFGPWVPPFVPFLEPHQRPVGKGIGHFVGCWRVDAFRPPQEYREAIDRWIEGMKSRRARPATEVLVPGEPERRVEEIRLREGVPIHPKVEAALQRLADRWSVALPDALSTSRS
jgi:LDH2 family malate/lactate/ureidoglycolate dehydrogenase